MTTRRSRLAPLAAALALIAILAIGATALADSPSPATGAVAAPSPAVSTVPGAIQTSRAACPNPTPGPTPSLAPGQTPGATRHPNLCPAQPGADPFSLLAWIFTPIFQVIFLGLVFAYKLVGDIGIAIILITILIRLLLVPVYRQQIVSQRRMQMLQPELKAISAKYKGDRTRISEEQMRLYRERGVNPASGCLPTLLTMVLLLPMYSVFSSGLTAPDISSMLHVFGVQVVDVACQTAATTGGPCINTTVHWLPDITTGQLLDASKPEVLFRLPFLFDFGFSVLALVSALLQLLQTRMMMPTSADPQAQAQQRTFMLLPLLSLVYGSFLPAGLFIYWIVTTIFSIVQQYLIAGWGSLFPLFGWTPAFARGHVPRFAPPPPAPKLSRDGGDVRAAHRTPEDSAAGTVRPNRDRTRTSRRGRRR